MKKKSRGKKKALETVQVAFDAAEAENLDCVPGTDIPKNSIGASAFDKPMTDEEREKAIETEMPHCAPAVKAWVRQNKLPISYMWQLESIAKEGGPLAKGRDDNPANVENPLFGYATFAELDSANDDQDDSRFELFTEGHSDEDRLAGSKIEDIIKQYMTYWDEPYLTDERAKKIATGNTQ